MEFRTLHNFLAVVREGNISRAAAVLNLTQPALSRQMSQLERELGCELFERGKRLELTESGVVLCRRAEEVERLMADMDAELSSCDDVFGMVRLGSGGLSAARLLANAMLGFRAANPHVDFELYTNCADHLCEHLDRGDLDFALLLEPAAIDRYDFIRTSVIERWGVLMRADHPLAQFERVDVNALANTLLAVSDRLPLQNELASWAGDRYASFDVAVQFNLINNVAVLVGESDVCAVTTEGSIGQLDSSRFAFRPLEPPLSMTTVIAWRKGAPLSRPAARFLAYLRNCMAADR